MLVSSKNSWFWEENKLFYTGKALITAWPIYLDLREPVFWRNGSLYLREIWQMSMLMNRSVFDQRMKLPYGWVTEVQKGIKLQNNKLPSRGRISRSCVLAKHRIVAFYVPVCVAFHFPHKLLWFLWNLNSSLSMPPPGGN